jgi:hypothetical protein
MIMLSFYQVMKAYLLDKHGIYIINWRSGSRRVEMVFYNNLQRNEVDKVRKVKII